MHELLSEAIKRIWRPKKLNCLLILGILESVTKLRVFSLRDCYQKSEILKVRNYNVAIIHCVIRPVILYGYVILGSVPKVSHRFRIGNL